MNKKILIIISIIVIICIAIVIFINLSNNDPTEENDEPVEFDLSNNIDLLMGTWDDTFYSLDEDTSGHWTFYSNGSIKLEISGYTYNDEFKTEYEWYKYKIENNQICIKYESQSKYICYDYYFGKSYDQISLTNGGSTDRSNINLNKIKNTY